MYKLRISNAIYKGAIGKESLIDLTIPLTFSGKVVLFVHGFMGFKDWGAWELVEEYFTSLGFGFCKYNVSHNGCSKWDGLNFVDLDAFAENNYSKEKEDLSRVMDWIGAQIQPMPELYVIGHSRGGGIALLNSADERIKKVATWAAISDISTKFPTGEELKNWRKTGIRIQNNNRTKQEMPMNFSQYEDFMEHKKSLDIKHAIKAYKKPLFLVHGNADTSVSISEGEELSKWAGVPLTIIKGANHTFGCSHPWEQPTLPKDLETVCKLTAEFFLRNT